MLTRVGGTSLEFSCVPAAGGTGILRMICRLNWEGIDRFGCRTSVELMYWWDGDRDKLTVQLRKNSLVLCRFRRTLM